MEIFDDISMSLMSPDASLVTEQISYCIWGSVSTSCKAFDNVKLSIYPDSNRIFVEIKLRWWAKLEKLEPFRRFWLKRAESASKEFIPKGWKVLIYYEKRNNEGSDEVRGGPKDEEGSDSNE